MGLIFTSVAHFIDDGKVFDVFGSVCELDRVEGLGVVLKCIGKCHQGISATVTFDDGEMVEIIVVLQLPPSEPWRMRVSLESLYGTCCDPGDVRAKITLPLNG